MIKEDNFKEVLNSYDFEETELVGLYSRNYGKCVMSVDFTRRRLIYPEDKGLKVHDKTTSNFERDENFVVFECVCRLLEKGYRPEHIELEPRWVVGHGASGGKADILVRDENGDSYIIIECKTAGKEYNDEKKNTDISGGQLFSYWQQVLSTKWLALYASNWEGGKITYKSDVIHSEDDANILKLSEKDNSILTYKNARNLEERFATWDETYGKEWLNNTIFDEESQAYKVGVPPLRKRNLIDFASSDSIISNFEEILRHNNVSDKENAFNRLVALFICKLVDEIEKNDDDEVEFQYKQGTDTYETLQDRLQRLHKRGMDEFMHEELFYVESDYADRLFQQYTGQKRKRAIAELNETIRKLKFYTNNDFAFKDVHNEELFYQNGKILVEVVQLFQPYRIVFSSKNQTLGELFERLLNKGFKQNEGQFFTPTPLTRFIWDALPLRSYIKNHGLPRMIDYSCGAAHFLTDGIGAIIAVAKEEGVEDINDSKWIQDCIFGIEKDYRLARVSKVSMFMNGAGNANIIFGDGLENYPDKGIKVGSFDILVANPPYSVQAFKQHLALKNNILELLNVITNTGSEIEVLFVERIAQLLKSCGIAAVILPASILSNDSNSYTKAREELLKNFFIRAIVCFGSNTFGATGTNTVTLFLEHYNEPPRVASLVQDSVDAIMNCNIDSDVSDSEVLRAYVSHQGITQDDYLRFISRDMSFEEIKENSYLKIYENIKDKVTIPRNASAEEKELIRRTKFYDSALAIERDKLYCFALVYKQRTLIITAPSNNTEQQAFLGYKWSNRRGSEGIQIIHAGGKLYDDKDRFKEGTLASAVRNSFAGKEEILSEELQKYAKTYWLKDLMDFSKEKFNKEIATIAKKTIEIKSKYNLTNLAQIAKSIEKGKSITQAQTVEGEYKVVAGGKDYAYTHNEYNREPNVITVSASGAYAGYVNLWKERIFASDCTTIYGNSDMETSFIYYYLKSVQDSIIEKLQKGSAQPHVYAKDLEKLQIPLPPMDIQEEIVKECEAIDEDYNQSRMSIDENQRKINSLFTEREKTSTNSIRLGDIVFINEKVINPTTTPNRKYVYIDISSVEGGTGEISFNNVIEGKDAPSRARRYAYSGSTLVSTVRPNLRAFAYISKEIESAVYSTGFAILRSKDESIILNEFLYVSFMFSESLMSQMVEKMPKGQYPSINKEDIESLQIILPPIDEQRVIVSQVNEYEQKIAEARNIMEGYSTRINAVLNKYLQ